MSEQHFTTRLEATLTRGMASVPLPALEPASARYRIAAARVGTRARPRLTVMVGATGLALFMGTMGAAASGTSPATVVTAAVHRVAVLIEQISTGESVPATSPADSSRPATVSQPPVAAPGDADRASQPVDSASPPASEEPAPPPTELPASQPEDTSASQSESPSDSPAPTL